MSESNQHSEPTEREFLEGLRYEDKFPDANRALNDLLGKIAELEEQKETQDILLAAFREEFVDSYREQFTEDSEDDARGCLTDFEREALIPASAPASTGIVDDEPVPAANGEDGPKVTMGSSGADPASRPDGDES